MKQEASNIRSVIVVTTAAGADAALAAAYLLLPSTAQVVDVQQSSHQVTTPVLGAQSTFTGDVTGAGTALATANGQLKAAVDALPAAGKRVVSMALATMGTDKASWLLVAELIPTYTQTDVLLYTIFYTKNRKEIVTDVRLVDNRDVNAII